MDLDAASASAIENLRRIRWRSGWWEDFDTLAGPSRDWVTGYVGGALAEASDASARALAEDAWSLLAGHSRPQGGWAYNQLVPPDADSTAWVLRLAGTLGVDPGESCVAAGRAFLSRHVTTGGGVATFAADGPIRAFTGVHAEISFAGWCSPHACVSAAVGGLDHPETPRVMDYLRQTQRADGSWPAYWWKGDGCATALAAEALSGAGGPGDRVLIDRAVDWAGARIGVELATPMTGSPFETAWCVCLLALGRAPWAAAALEHALAWLVEHQRPDGSWTPSAKLRIPPPHVVDPGTWGAWEWNGRGGSSLQVDAGGAFTTATVLKALTRAHAAAPARGRAAA